MPFRPACYCGCGRVVASHLPRQQHQATTWHHNRRELDIEAWKRESDSTERLMKNPTLADKREQGHAKMAHKARVRASLRQPRCCKSSLLEA